MQISNLEEEFFNGDKKEPSNSKATGLRIGIYSLKLWRINSIF